jgi:hypothetical protein
VLALLPLVASALAAGSFTAHYEGAVIGLGDGCVVVDSPPRGAWTVFVSVVDPGDSGLDRGALLCAVVHSPTLWQASAFPRRKAHCRLAEGEPAGRWSCTVRSPDELALFAVPPPEPEPPRDPRLARLVDAVDGMAADLDAMADCPDVAQIGMLAWGRETVEQGRMALDAGDAELYDDVVAYLDEVQRQIDAMKPWCLPP